jgi:hypothetical protein
MTISQAPTPAPLGSFELVARRTGTSQAKRDDDDVDSEAAIGFGLEKVLTPCFDGVGGKGCV